MQYTKLHGGIIKSIIILCAMLACIFITQAIVAPTGESEAKLSEIFLAQPAFAQQATAFPADEAGISAYVNLGQSIDLRKLRAAFQEEDSFSLPSGNRAFFRDIAKSGDNWIIGTVGFYAPIPINSSPYVYVDSQGWIVAYYPRSAVTARITPFNERLGWDLITTTTLEDAIAAVCLPINVDYANNVEGKEGYYHFRYPDASRLELAVQRVRDDETNTFQFTIPYEATVFEGSWAATNFGHGQPSVMKVDDENLFEIEPSQGLRTEYGAFRSTHLYSGSPHIITISDEVIAAVAFIYR